MEYLLNSMTSVMEVQNYYGFQQKVAKYKIIFDILKILECRGNINGSFG